MTDLFVKIIVLFVVLLLFTVRYFLSLKLVHLLFLFLFFFFSKFYLEEITFSDRTAPSVHGGYGYCCDLFLVYNKVSL